MDKWIINIMDKVGFSCYDLVDVREVVDLKDCYNIITDTGDMFIEKDYCNIVYGVTGSIRSIEYKNELIEVFIERLDEEEITVAA